MKSMSCKIEMTYGLSAPDENGFKLGKAQTTVRNSDEQQDFEAIFRIKSEFRNSALESVVNSVLDDASRIPNITIHPTLIMQLTLIRV